MLSLASHVAVWPGLYVVSAGVFAAQVGGVHPRSVPVAVASCGVLGCTAIASYLLDRVKLRDAWLDPADAMGESNRHQFLTRHAAAVRVAIVVLLGVGTACGWSISPWIAPAPVLAASGVLVYAGRPRRHRARPKDVLLLKNAFTAGGITAFAFVIMLASMARGRSLGSILGVASAHRVAISLAAIFLGGRIFADAVLCDIDDIHRDHHHGTATLPIELGVVGAWNAAMAIRLVLSAGLLFTTELPRTPRMCWAIATVASTLWLRVARPGAIRNWVDARFAIESACVSVALALLNCPVV